ncbi:MAG: hypothetical protein ACOY30_10470 [Bacillota bacterium]
MDYLRGHPDTGLVGTLYAGFKKDVVNSLERPANWIRYGDDIEKTCQKGLSRHHTFQRFYFRQDGWIHQKTGQKG